MARMTRVVHYVTCFLITQLFFLIFSFLFHYKSCRIKFDKFLLFYKKHQIQFKKCY